MLPRWEQISLIIYGGERGTQRGTSARKICAKIIFCGVNYYVTPGFSTRFNV